MNRKLTLIAGSFLAGLGVALGAVGSHALKEILMQNNRTETFEAAVRYQLYHAITLLVVGLLMNSTIQWKLKWVATLFLSGSVLFSGSLYLLALSPVKWIVFVTPVGGVLMIGGWVLLLVHFVNTRE